MKPEAHVLAECLVAVSAIAGTMIWRNNSGALRDSFGRLVRFGLKGSPDIIGVCRGRAIAIECKRAGKKPTRGQRNFATGWTNAGGIYIVARCVDDVLPILATLPIPAYVGAPYL